MTDQKKDKELEDFRKMMQGRGMSDEEFDKLSKRYPLKSSEPGFEKINDKLWLFKALPKAVGFTQQETEGKWVCVISNTHWGFKGIGSCFTLEQAKQRIIGFYKEFF